MKILITGGHVTPALALIDELKAHKIVFIGRKYPLEGEKTISLEYKEISKLGIKFIHLKTGRFTRLISLRTLRSMLRIPLGFLHAAKIIFREKPDMIFSFGGYIALPICVWGYIFKVPLYTHEQTIHPGAANRFIARLARKVFVSFEETVTYFPKWKTIVSGNPIRKEIFDGNKKLFELTSDNKKVLYVTGGSLGAHSINLHIDNIIEKLLEDFIVLHQVGDTQEFNDFKKALEKKSMLSPDHRKNYFPSTHFSGEEIGWIYKVSDIIIARSGANTCFEIAALEKPVIFIPLPWSSFGEQKKQAQLFEKAGCGEIFSQSEQSEKLYTLIKKVVSHQYLYEKNFKNLKFPRSKHAALTIVKNILTP